MHSLIGIYSYQALQAFERKRVSSFTFRISSAFHNVAAAVKSTKTHQRTGGVTPAGTMLTSLHPPT